MIIQCDNINFFCTYSILLFASYINKMIIVTLLYTINISLKYCNFYNIIEGGN